MKKLLKILFALLTVIAVFAFVTITTGNPIYRYTFKYESNNYLGATYPDLKIKKMSVKYDFKQGDFFALVQTETGVFFRIYDDYNGKKIDTLFYSTWMDEIKRYSTIKAVEVLGPSTEVVVNVMLAPNEELKKFDKVPSYSEVSDNFAPHTTISFVVNLPKDTLLTKCFEMVKWLIQEKYFAQVSFTTEEKETYIRIPYNELDEVKSEEDLVKFMVD